MQGRTHCAVVPCSVILTALACAGSDGCREMSKARQQDDLECEARRQGRRVGFWLKGWWHRGFANIGGSGRDWGVW
ncbi:hypothetical protein BJ875DRAFT_460360 [Amylocarpus encephaloides]|uniref:Secreted protein n=1 Tax=Amylocarpus encephaloides TaxID=45428 RepID=A0A9P7YJB9_9HELO|nr:hypothetical protein BJ875DRAFT_460360 [Amylocarpus encephaloides]